MSGSSVAVALLTLLVSVGCASQAKFLDSKQPMAMQTAVSRARFETNCPEATGTVLSREVTQPPVEGPRMVGIQRAEFTIGVAGCGQRSTLVVICPDGGEGCFAADRR